MFRRKAKSAVALGLLGAMKTEGMMRVFVRSAAGLGLIPAKLEPAFSELYTNYKEAVLGSGVEGKDAAEVAGTLNALACRVLKEYIDPYTFPSYHERITAPFDYYALGQRYTSSLIDISNSYLGHEQRFAAIQELLEAGDNVILLANHQTEADPGVWATLLEQKFPELAENLVYVAGDRVVSDALCKPFSMGRNLFTIFSKKHMAYQDASTKKAQMKQNMTTVRTMQKMLNEGGNVIWIAPSGGRDRPDASGVFQVADFDPASVELMRKLGSKAKKKTHLFPLAMFSHAIMPPPAALEKDVGEQRLTFFSGCAISVVEEMDEEAVLAGVAEEDRLQVFADAVQAVVTEEYKVLEAMVETRAADRGAVAAPYSMPCPAGAAPGGAAPELAGTGLSDKSNDAAWNSW